MSDGKQKEIDLVEIEWRGKLLLTSSNDDIGVHQKFFDWWWFVLLLGDGRLKDKQLQH